MRWIRFTVALALLVAFTAVVVVMAVVLMVVAPPTDRETGLLVPPTTPSKRASAVATAKLNSPSRVLNKRTRLPALAVRVVLARRVTGPV